MDIEFDNLFQDSLVFSSIGRNYYSEVYPGVVKERDGKRSGYIKKILNLTFEVKSRGRRKKTGVLILEPMFERLFRDLDPSYQIYLLHDSGKFYRDYKKSDYIQFFYRDWQKAIDKSFLSHDMSYANKAAESVQAYIRKNNIKAVVMGNDKRFIERLIVISAQQMGIPAVIIQHGIYSDEYSFGKLLTANTADYFWSWSEYTRECYLKRFNKNPDRVKVIGYPFKMLEHTGSGKSVLFIGNQYKVNKGEKEEHLKIADTVLKICKEQNIDFIYRPHPGETIDGSYGDLSEHISCHVDLIDDLSESKLVVGDISTALVEAGLCGLNVVQVIWNDNSRNALTNPIYDFTKKVSNDYDEIKNAITELISSDERPQLNEYYLYNNPDIMSDAVKYLTGAIHENCQDR